MRLLQLAYGVLAAVGLGTALWFGAPYWSSPGASFAGFSELAYANGPAATLSADVTVLYVLANLFVIVEGRRLGMKRLWAYVIANTLVAVAVGLPLFLLARERRLVGADASPGAAS